MNVVKRRRFMKTLAAGAVGAVSGAGAGVAVAAVSSAIKGSTNFAAEFKPTWIRAKECTLEYAAAMPAETYQFKPVPEVRSFADQMLHIADSSVWFLSNYLVPEKQLSRDYTPEGKTKAQTLELVGEAFDFVGEAIGEMTDEQLVETVRTFVGPLTKKEIILLMRDHVTHHRGQSVVYLRLNGVTPPTWVGH